MIGKIKNVKIFNGNQNTLFGELIEKNNNEEFMQHRMSEITKLDQNLIIKKIDKQTINVQFNDNEMLMTLVGQFDQNLKDLSKLTNTEVYFRGNSITCKGKVEKINEFCNAVKFLSSKYYLTKIIEKEDIVLSSVKKIWK